MLLLLNIPGEALNRLVQDSHPFMWIIKSQLLIKAEFSEHIYLFSTS